MNKKQNQDFYRLQNQYNAVVKQNKSLQKELRGKTIECEELRQILNKKQEHIEQLIAPDISAFEEMPKWLENESLYSLWKKYEKLKG